MAIDQGQCKGSASRENEDRKRSSANPPHHNWCSSSSSAILLSCARTTTPEGLRDGFDALCGVLPWVKSHFGWLWQLEFCVLISRVETVYVDFMH